MQITKKVGIVVLTWNDSKNTIECLKSILKSDYNKYDIILVNNNSTKNHILQIKKWGSKRILEITKQQGNEHIVEFKYSTDIDISMLMMLKKYLDDTNLINLAFANLFDGIIKIFDIKIDSYAAIRKNTFSNLDKNFFIKKNFINIANKGLFI
jgi:cellulose synthase/poly-beta-1,6-N-acetylglucosamine synthase-like glycosyltransferase